MYYPSVDDAIAKVTESVFAEDPFEGLSTLQMQKKMLEMPIEERKKLLEQRRPNVLGSKVSPSSVGTYASSLRVYGRHCDITGERPFPVTQANVESFLGTKTNAGTARSAVSAIATACGALNVPLVLDKYGLNRIYKGLKQKYKENTNAKDPIYPADVDRICAGEDESTGKPVDVQTVTLAQVTSSFLLRAKSESLPLSKGAKGDHDNMKPKELKGRHSAVFRSTNEREPTVTITIGKRKNGKPFKTVRGCSCRSNQTRRWCAVCDLLPYLDTVEPGERLFPAWKYFNFLSWVKNRCQAIGLKGNFGSHSLRKGMARAIARSDAGLLAILEAGGWTSRAFSVYLSKEELEQRGTLRSGLSDADDDSDNSDGHECDGYDERF